MDNKVYKTAEEYAERPEKTALEKLKEKSEELMAQVKKLSIKLIKDSIDVDDDENVYYMKKFKKLMNSCEEINSLTFDYMADQEKLTMETLEHLVSIEKKETEMIEAQKETNKLLKEILKQEGNNCTVLGRIAEKK